MKKIGLLAVAVLISAVTFAQTSTPATAPAPTTPALGYVWGQPATDFTSPQSSLDYLPYPVPG